VLTALKDTLANVDPLTVTVVGGVVVAAVTAVGGGLIKLIRRRSAASTRVLVPVDPPEQPQSSVELVVSVPGPAPQAVHNLGARHDLLGRSQELQTLLRTLASLKQPLIIVGPPGIGKSSAAIEASYRLVNPNRSDPSYQAYDYILFFTARLEPFHAARLVDEIARWTGNMYIMKLPDVSQKLMEIRAILARSRCLLILDNLESVEDNAIFEFIEAIPFPSQLLGTSAFPDVPFDDITHVYKVLFVQQNLHQADLAKFAAVEFEPVSSS
jgi:hypothetical protein